MHDLMQEQYVDNQGISIIMISELLMMFTSSS